MPVFQSPNSPFLARDMKIERRNKRSEDPLQALVYQLETVREAASFEALVLADKDGIAVAVSGDRAVCAELAAIAPFVGKTLLRVPMPALLSGADVAVKAMHVHGQSLFLASVGGNVAREAMLARSLGGVERILRSN